MEKINKIYLILKKYHIAVVSAISISFVIICWFSTYFIFKDSETEYRSSFGSMFGGIESLFSGLAFCGIIITILLQSSELKLQREEMKLQREEMQENRKELERTTKAQQNQEVSLNRQAENLKISAKLSALNSLASYYTEKAKISQNSTDFLEQRSVRSYLDKSEFYIERIEEILNRKERN